MFPLSTNGSQATILICYQVLRFDCHIHVDVVTATACIKYLFKYCHKTEDYARARIQGMTDEIELYRKTGTSLPLKQRGDCSAFK